MEVKSLWLDEESLPVVTLQPQVVRSLLLVMAAKHWPTCLHMCQVAVYTEMLALWLKLPPAEFETAVVAAQLHDIGKIAVPDEVLTKPGRLLDQELEVMTFHVEWGAEILSRIGGFEAVVDAVRYHHEWVDGRGYPAGLSGDAIPLSARMIGIADAFDTMTRPRPYQGPVPVELALKELELCSGTQFDGELVAAFAAMMREACARDSAPRSVLRPAQRSRVAEPLAVRFGR